MRILQVIPNFYPAFAFGGPAKVAYDISKELARRDHEVEVFTTNAYDQDSNFKPKSKELELAGFKVTYFNNLLQFNNIFVSPELVAALRKKTKDFDVVNIHFGRQIHDVAASFYAQLYGVPYVVQAHGGLPRIMSNLNLKLVFDVLFGHKVLKNASKVIAFNQMEMEQYRIAGVTQEKIEIIPNGLDLAEFANLPPKGIFKKKFNINQDTKVLLYLGRINRTKGVDFLITAYSHMVKKFNFNNTMLVIAGPDDGYLGYIKSLTQTLGIANRVLFTGLLTEREKICAFVDSTIVLYLSYFEPFGLVTLEAAASSKPVIVSDSTPMAAVIKQGKFGFSVKYGDKDELAEKINTLINDELLRQKMGRTGRCFVFENFSWANIVPKIEKVYADVIAHSIDN